MKKSLIMFLLVGISILFAGCSNSFEFEENTNFTDNSDIKSDSQEHEVNVQVDKEKIENITNEVKEVVEDATIEAKEVAKDIAKDVEKVIDEVSEELKNVDIDIDVEIKINHSNDDNVDNQYKVGDDYVKIAGNVYYAPDIEVDAKLDEGEIELEWDEFKGEHYFKYYKVMHSTTDSDPRYPDQSALFVISDIDDNFATDKKNLDIGTHYYRVCVVLTSKDVICGDVEKIIHFEEEQEDNEEEEEVHIDEKLSIIVGEDEKVEFTLDNEEHYLKLGDLLDGSVGDIEVNGKTEYNFDIYESVEVDGLTIVAIDIVYSSRESVKGYAEFVVANYDYEVEPEDVICYEGENEAGIKTVYGLDDSLLDFIVKSNYCSGDTLNAYECGDNEKVDSYQTVCSFGCDNGRCLSEIEAGCEHEQLLGGPFSLGEGEGAQIQTNTSTYNLVIESVSSSSVLLTVNNQTKSVDGCEITEIDGLKIMITDIISSNNDAVKGYVEYTYE